MKKTLLSIKEFLGKNKDWAICILIVILAIFGLVVRVNDLEEEKKSSYDSDWRYHHYSRSYNNNSNTNNTYAESVNSNNNSYNNSTSNDDPYGKEFYDDVDDFADDNAVEFGDGDEDDGWDDAYDYYEK